MLKKTIRFQICHLLESCYENTETNKNIYIAMLFHEGVRIKSISGVLSLGPSGSVDYDC